MNHIEYVYVLQVEQKFIDFYNAQSIETCFCNKIIRYQITIKDTMKAIR